MANIIALKRMNAQRWASMKLDEGRLPQFDAAAKEYCKAENKARFQAVTKRLIELGYQAVPWWFIAIVAEREYGRNKDGTLRWDRQLGQGDLLSKVSHNVPAGRGPFLTHEKDDIDNNAWLRCCLDALINCAPFAAKWTDWSIGGVLTLWEEYNGLGYANMGVPSAYVFSGTDQYVSGKYVADHVYRVNAVDVQEGCAPLLARMMMVDKSIVIGEQTKEIPMPPTTPTQAPIPVPVPVQAAHIDFAKIESFVEVAAKFAPIASSFFPPLKVVLPFIPVLEGALKMADDLQKGNGTPIQNAAIVASNLHNMAAAIEAAFSLPNLHLPGVSPEALKDVIGQLGTGGTLAGQNQAGGG